MTYSDYSYENFRRVSYDGAVFVPVCDKCGRFVKADDELMVNGLGEVSKEPNAICSKCGRINMPFEGWFDPNDF